MAIVDVLLAQRVVWVSLAIGAAVVGFTAVGLRRLGRPSVAIAGAAASAWVACTLALFSIGGFGSAGPNGLDQCRAAVSAPALWRSLGTVEGLGNLVLLAPLAFFLVVAGVRAPWAFIGAAALSTALEVAQAIVGSRDCAVSDLVLNAAGAVLGAGLARSTMRARRSVAAASRRPAT